MSEQLCPHCTYPLSAHDQGDGWTDEQVTDACLAYGMESVREARREQATVRKRRT